jgi:hypothetical protein
VAQRLQPLLLLALSGGLLALLIAYRADNFLLLLRRTRWILLSLLLIYAFATPGLYLLPDFGSASPSIEGLRAGAMQTWRLLLMLAALALVLRCTDREALLSGIYTLLKPLQPLGVNAERIAVRLWLTLRYVEGGDRKTAGQDWMARLNLALQPGDAQSEVLRLQVVHLRWTDWLTLGAALLSALMVA